MHLTSLDRLFEKFFDSDPYRVDYGVEAVPAVDAIMNARDHGGWRATLAGPPAPREIVLTGRVTRQPPAQRAGVLVADVVNNLRAALDHVVWRLAPEPIPRKGAGREWRLIGWPIALEQSAWTPTAAMRLRYVDPGVWAEFERLQPFSRRQQQPERDEFALLDELWNVYKHRHLPLTQLWVGLDKAVSLLNRVEVFDAPRGYGDGLRKQLGEHSYVIISGSGPQPFIDGAELGRIREAAPPTRGGPSI